MKIIKTKTYAKRDLMYGYGVCYECKGIKTTLHEYKILSHTLTTAEANLQRQFCSEQCFEPYRLWITEGTLTSYRT